MARAADKQVIVQWSIPTSAAPQIGYKLEVFGHSGAKDAPLQVIEDTAPHVFARRLDTPRAAKSVRLTVTDIVDQQTSTIIPVGETRLESAAEVAGVRPGLTYAYDEAPGDTKWDRLPDFSTLTPASQGYVAGLDDTVRQEREKLYALHYTGYLRVPADGLYVLSAGTCDGSCIRIGDKVIVDNDRIHSASVKQYPIALKKGLHAFELRYFKGPSDRHHDNLTDRISIGWEGPGFGLRRLSEQDFVCQGKDAPSLSLALGDDLTGGVLTDNLAEIRAKATLHGHRLTKVDLYNGRMLLKSAERAEVAAAAIVFRSLLPAGRNRLWARLWYDDDHSVDADNVLDFETLEYIERGSSLFWGTNTRSAHATKTARPTSRAKVFVWPTRRCRGILRLRRGLPTSRWPTRKTECTPTIGSAFSPVT